MNLYFSESRSMKFISPFSGNTFTVDMTGTESEIKELFSTLLSVKPSAIKGITDNFGNYYTFASILRNFQVNPNSVYYLVLNQNEDKSKDTSRSNTNRGSQNNETTSKKSSNKIKI